MMNDIFKKLSKIDCSKHVEKKGQLSYLSWTWAWQMLVENFPSSRFEFFPDDRLPDGSVMVSCAVTVEDTQRIMWLPVMDNRNNAIMNPDARKISDARMRCLVKCIALHGLGLYIYAGEDLPQVEVEYINDAQVAQIKMILSNTKAIDAVQFCKVSKIKNIEALESSRFDGALKFLMSKVEGESDGAK